MTDCHYIQALFHTGCALFSSPNLLLTFQYILSVPSLGVKNPKDIMRPIHYPKTLVRIYHYMLRSDTEQRSSQLLLKSLLKTHKEHTLSGS